jgi:hypothetical protein
MISANAQIGGNTNVNTETLMMYFLFTANFYYLPDLNTKLSYFIFFQLTLFNETYFFIYC